MHTKGEDGKCHNRSTLMCIPAMCAHFTFPSLQKYSFPYVFGNRQEGRNLFFNAKGFLVNMFMLCFMTTLHFCPLLILVHHYLCQSSVALICHNLNKHGLTNISMSDETPVFANMFTEGHCEESCAASPVSAGSPVHCSTKTSPFSLPVLKKPLHAACRRINKIYCFLV